MLEAAILGILQGITEFLPVSSTAHLIIMPWFFNWSGQVNTLSFDITLHAGTLLSIIVCLWKDISDILKKNRAMIFYVAIATAPAVLAGLYLHDYASGSLRNPYIISSTLVGFGILMLVSEKFKRKKDMKGMNLIDALFIGIMQAAAIVPGVSRSGITISGGLMRGIRRDDAARFSFILSIPVICGAIVFDAKSLLSKPEGFDMGVFASGFAASAITGIIAIKFLLGYLKKHTVNIFVYYRFALAAFIVGWLWLIG